MPEPAAVAVLVVDDHPVVREGLAALVRASPGLTVWGSAASGPDALAQLDGESPPGRPDVVVTDYAMPGMTGVELAAALRSAWPDLPCVVFSARSAATFAERARAAGARAYVEKGDPAAIVEAIRAVTSGPE